MILTHFVDAVPSVGTQNCVDGGELLPLVCREIAHRAMNRQQA
jgi:hypothetical protein